MGQPLTLTSGHPAKGSLRQRRTHDIDCNMVRLRTRVGAADHEICRTCKQDGQTVQQRRVRLRVVNVKRDRADYKDRAARFAILAGRYSPVPDTLKRACWASTQNLCRRSGPYVDSHSPILAFSMNPSSDNKHRYRRSPSSQ